MRRLILSGLIALLLPVMNLAAETPSLQAGTGKASIDPPATLFPLKFPFDFPPIVGIHDSLFARALAIQSGSEKSVILVADMIAMPPDLYEEAAERITKDYGIPHDNILIMATHAHTVPWSFDGGYGAVVMNGLMAAAKDALGHLEPVSVGTGNGKAFININRDEAVKEGFALGQNPEGPSDKTVRVVAFYRADGSPLAILANYAVHGVVLHDVHATDDGNLISADIPGRTDRFVDEHYKNRTLTLWTSGAAGDQNPVIMGARFVRDGNGDKVLVDMKAAAYLVVDALSESLGKEIIAVTDRIKPLDGPQPLQASQTILECPAKRSFAAPAPVPIRVSYLGLGSIQFVAISGEVGTVIDRHFREQSGDNQAMLMTLANGSVGYIPDDGSYQRGDTYEVTSSALKPGCAETKIIDAALKMTGSARH